MLSANRLGEGDKEMGIMQEAMQKAGITGTESAEGSKSVNLSEIERWGSAIGGGALAVYGLTRGTMGGVALALVGGAILYRGLTGHCEMYEAMGINTAGTEERGPNVSVPAERGIKVEKSLTINRPPEELYRFWRNFENLPRFMNHLESVKNISPERSHWVAKGPAGTNVEW